MSIIKIPALLTLSLLLIVPTTQAELYRWTDERGQVHYSDKKNASNATVYKPETTISIYNNPDGIQIAQQKADYSDLPPYEQRRETPDIEKLQAVPFPQNPNRTSIATYIQKIYAISRFQKTHLRSDPQVSLLMQVGTEYLDILIRETYAHVGWHNYGLEAIKQLATDQHKQQILKSLKNYNKYAEVIYIKGWHHDIEDELVKGLAGNRGYVPSEWLQAVSEFDREDARQALIDYFKYGWNNHTTYRIIASKNNMQSEIETALPAAWETAHLNNKYAMAELTPKVLELGYLPAFRFVMQSLLDNASMQKHWFDAYGLAQRYTGQTGSAKEIMAWYRKNQKKIHFDSNNRMYVADS